MFQINISNTDVSYSIYRCFIQYLPMFQIYISNTDVSYSIYRCFIQYLPMFQIYISNTHVSYSIYRCFIHLLPMIQIYIPNTDVSYSIYRCFIPYLPMFHIYISVMKLNFIFLYCLVYLYIIMSVRGIRSVSRPLRLFIARPVWSVRIAAVCQACGHVCSFVLQEVCHGEFQQCWAGKLGSRETY